MRLNYIHKISKQKVSLEQLKEYEKQNVELSFYMHDSINYRYMAFSIPFSEDFEIECVDEEFTEEEYAKIIHGLKINPFEDEKLISKIENKYITLIRNNHC